MMNYKTLSVSEMLRIRAGNQETLPTGGESGAVPSVEPVATPAAGNPGDKPDDIEALKKNRDAILDEKKRMAAELKAAKEKADKYDAIEKEKAENQKTLETKLSEAHAAKEAAEKRALTAALSVELIKNGVNPEAVQDAVKAIADEAIENGAIDNEKLKAAIAKRPYYLMPQQAPVTTTGAPRGNAPGNSLNTWTPVADLEAEYKKHRST